MVLKDFFKRISENRSFQRQLKFKKKAEELEVKAFRFEREAELKTDVGKKQERIRKAKREIFESSPAFKAIEGFKQAGKQLRKAGAQLGKKSRGGGLAFGAAQEDLFFGGAPQPRRKKKISRQESEDDIFGDLGTDRFF